MAWSPIYASADDLAAWLAEADPVADAAELALAVEAASRAIDQATGRQFGLVVAPEPRYYTAEFDRTLGQWIIDIDDLQTTAGLIVAVDNGGDDFYSESITAYSLSPANAVPNGRPWTRITVKSSSLVKPNGRHNGVRVTALWGWSSIPDAIKLATLTQASRLYDRRESPSGPLSSKKVDDVSYGWRATDLDTDVATAVAPYRKVWAAA
jgi:hypothetical protein